MTTGRAYLDWNASAPLLPQARAAMLAAMEVAGNPSSIHAEGRAARAIVEQARAEVAALVGGDPDGVVFTSGATEAANALLQHQDAHDRVFFAGEDHPPQGPAIFLEIEHACVLGALMGPSTGTGGLLPMRVRASGLIELAELESAFELWVKLGVEVRRPRIVAQLANNETGIIQDIPAIAAAAHAKGGYLICDAVQGPGKLTIDMTTHGADAIFLSAHKFGGPKGVGAIVFNGAARLQNPLVKGGGQERGNRGGTENVIGIAGMGAAAKAVREAGDPSETMRQLHDHFEKELKRIAPDVHVVGRNSPRLANTSCFAIPGILAEQALIALDLDGIALSSGSACSSGKVKASHVLKAMGEHDFVRAGALRLSIGPTTTLDDIEKCLMSLERLVKRRKAAA